MSPRSYPEPRWTSYDDLRCQAWARQEQRMSEPLRAVRGMALGLVISVAFWGVLIGAYVVGQR